MDLTRPTSTQPDARVVVLGGMGDTLEPVVHGLSHRPGLTVIVASTDVDVADRLRARSAMPVEVVRGRTRLQPNRVFVLAPDVDLVVEKYEVVVGSPSPGRLMLDKVLRTAGDHHGRATVGVVLAGHGNHGVLGLKRLKEFGALTVAQAILDGPGADMPQAAVATGMVDLVLPLDEIAPRILGAARELADGTADASAATVAADALSDTLRDVLTLVRLRTGHDFAAYKRATLFRRVSRRMLVCETQTIVDYHRYLTEHPVEVFRLLHDFLVSVTNFFRDPAVFDALVAQVLPVLFAGKSPGDPVRVWVAGCATGEEAYSLGTLLLEHVALLREPYALQIFATDIDDIALAEARGGYYSEAISSDVSAERLDRFFVREADGYRVGAELRELVLFSPHNVLRDPPFSRLDVVSCRNLMIYLNREAQERALGVFHFALRTDGHLLLGSSESADHSRLFAPLDARQRIFSRRPAASGGLETMVPTGRWQPRTFTIETPVPPSRTGSVGELHHRLVEQLAPPSLLVNEELDVLHVSEHANAFLHVEAGEPTRQVLRMVIPALQVDLRAAAYAVQQGGRTSDTRLVQFVEDGKPRCVELRVYRGAEGTRAGALLIVFAEVDPVAPITAREVSTAASSIEPVVRGLEAELQRTRDQLRSTIEQYETSNEELKASNEELKAINEELRSTTEELETSKEELQSVNEELTTLNHELKRKVEEISSSNGDLQNLMASTDIAVLFLDPKLKIKRFTPRLQALFNVIPSDVGRPLAHLTHRLVTEDLPGLAAQVLETAIPVERDVRTRDGRLYLTRWLPYRSLTNLVEGVVITFVDVSVLRDATDARSLSDTARTTSDERLRVALQVAPLIVLSIDHRGATTWGFAFGHELPAGDGGTEVMERFAPGAAYRFAEVVQSVLASGKRERLEIELVMEGVPRPFEFRLEPVEAGVVVVGYDRAALSFLPAPPAP